MKHFSHPLAKIHTFLPNRDELAPSANQDDFPLPNEYDNNKIGQLIDSAEQGDVEAQCKLGDLFYLGKIVILAVGEPSKQEVDAAFKWWSKAAEQGNAKAQCCLGYCYWYGEGTPQDKKASFYWYRKAAEQGEKIALYCLASFYLRGTEVDANRDKAIKLYQESAKQGYSLALKRLEELNG